MTMSIKIVGGWILNNLKNVHLLKCQRYYSQKLSEQYATNSDICMSAWQVTSYGADNNLHLSERVEIPTINGPNDVLIKVCAASVNPLDVEMLNGFGSVLLNNMRWLKSLNDDETVKTDELPLILGRDFAGIVVAKGCLVNNFELGDEIYGVVKPQDQGCHAEYTITSDSLLTKKPEFISMEEASAILYTSLTAWSALKISGNFILNNPKNKRVLVLGGSGGVGNAAIQLLNAWEAEAITTCRTDAIPFVEKFSPKMIIDYSLPNFESEVKSTGPFDIVLDAAGLGEKRLVQYISLLKSCGSIVTLTSPLLANIDNYGLLRGSVKSIIDLAVPNIKLYTFKNGTLMKWAFFIPSNIAVKEISTFVNHKKIIPNIEKVYKFSELPEAYSKMQAGHLRGKIVVSMNELNQCNKN